MLAPEIPDPMIIISAVVGRGCIGICNGSSCQDERVGFDTGRLGVETRDLRSSNKDLDSVISALRAWRVENSWFSFERNPMLVVGWERHHRSTLSLASAVSTLVHIHQSVSCYDISTYSVTFQCLSADVGESGLIF